MHSHPASLHVQSPGPCGAPRDRSRSLPARRRDPNTRFFFHPCGRAPSGPAGNGLDEPTLGMMAYVPRAMPAKRAVEGL
jgi:hypothetical protein